MFVASCPRCGGTFYSAARENLRSCVECNARMEARVADMSSRSPRPMEQDGRRPPRRRSLGGLPHLPAAAARTEIVPPSEVLPLWHTPLQEEQGADW